MEAALYLFGYLHNLFLLQGLADLDEFRGIAALDGTVDVAGIRQAHDDVPARLLGKHLEGLRLVHVFSQLGGFVPVGHAQQQSLLVAVQSPHPQVSGTGHQRAVVVVHGVAQRVVVGVYLSAGLQQLHLVRESAFLEDADGLFVGGFSAAERHVQVDDFLHAALDLLELLVIDGHAVLLLEVAVVAAAQRVLDEEFRARQHVLRGLVEHEAEATDIDAVPGAFAGVEELHVAVLVQAELQPL